MGREFEPLRGHFIIKHLPYQPVGAFSFGSSSSRAKWQNKPLNKQITGVQLEKPGKFGDPTRA